MPTNKNALTRYKYLDEMLSDRHHFYDIHDLTKKCNEKLIDAGFPEVSQRCVEKDVDSKTKCNVLVFKSSRFKEESVNFAS